MKTEKKHNGMTRCCNQVRVTLTKQTEKKDNDNNEKDNDEPLAQQGYDDKMR